MLVSNGVQSAESKLGSPHHQRHCSGICLVTILVQTHKPNQTKININEFDMAKIAAQLLYSPVFFVCFILFIFVS